MDPQEWLEVIRREYLEDFIRDGGGAVKFVVPAAGGRGTVQAGLRAGAERNGYVFAHVDAEFTKIHLLDRVFHEVARQIDWASLTRSFLRRSLPAMGYRLPDATDGDGDWLTLSAVAAANDYPEPLFQTEVTRGIWNRIFHDMAMTREFRLAMIRLCLTQLDQTNEPTLAEAIHQWLTGELRLISALKRALIFQRIGRHNAQHMLCSLAHWLTLAGKSGLVLSLDITRFGAALRPRERGSGLYYSTPACLDGYEMLRQLIDATDELEFCLVGVTAGPEFLTDDRRGLRSYHALYLRVADEVRDRFRPNPRSSLVRLAAGPTGPGSPSGPGKAEMDEDVEGAAP